MNLSLQGNMLLGYDRSYFPRWVNVDNLTARDTLTGLFIRLTVDPKADASTQNKHAMVVVDALNRIYRQEEL